MKVLRITIVFIFLFISVAHADAVRVSGFQAYPQEKSNWCWAASIQSIFLTHGLQVSQSQIVTAAYGSPVNTTAPGFSRTLNILNGLCVSVDGSIWRVTASARNTYPSANWLYQKLNIDEPVMVWFKDSNTNHSIIINGGRYFRDMGGNIQWIDVYAFDPLFNKNMTINASNIPMYVYGSFNIEVQRTGATE